MNATRALGLAALVVALAGLVVGGAAVGGVAGQDGPPSTPAAYYGQVTLDDGEPVDGVTVHAVVDDEVRDSVETDADGSFGGSGAFDEKLTVEGPVDGDVTFRVEGVDAETVAWESGANEEVPLELEDPPASDDEGDETDPGDDTDPEDGDETDPGDDTGADPVDGGDGSGPSGDTGAPDGTGPGDDTDGTGEGADPSGDAPTDAPSVEDVVEVPEDATTVAGEVASVETGPDETSSSVTFTGETAVEGIDFGSAVEGDVGVAEFEDAPESTGRPPGAGVSVMEITVPEAARDAPATVRTRVDADRLAETDADAEDLRLSRHSDGEWQALETSVVERDDGAVVLAAETPGFSVFAASVVSEPEAAVTVEPDDLETGEAITLSGETSSDEYGEIVAYDWDVAGEAADGSVTEMTFSEPGEYTVELRVTNDAGETDSTTETVAVEPAGAGEAAPAEEPGFLSSRTLGAVVGALVIALLVVAAARRADR